MLKLRAPNLVQLGTALSQKAERGLNRVTSPLVSSNPHGPILKAIERSPGVTQDNECSGKSPGRHQPLELRLHHSRNYLFCKDYEYKWSLLHIMNTVSSDYKHWIEKTNNKQTYLFSFPVDILNHFFSCTVKSCFGPFFRSSISSTLCIQMLRGTTASICTYSTCLDLLPHLHVNKPIFLHL